MMMRWGWAILIALGIHGLLAVGFGVILSCAPVERTVPQLDLSQVELSLSEQVSETAPLQTVEPVPPPPAAAEPQPEIRPPAPSETPPIPEIPPEMASVLLPEPPPEPPEPLDLPPRKEEVAQETSAKVETPADNPVTELERPEEAPAPLSPPMPAPDQARVDVAPKLHTGFDMKRIYPRESRLRGEEGDVSLLFEISARGTVTSVSVVASSGFPALDAAALKAARKATFAPAREGKRPVRSTARLTLNFRLSK